MSLEEQSAVRATGKVLWFNDIKGYGFITSDDGGEELFVHQSSIVSHGFRSLTVGESVEFAVALGGDGKTKAVDVTAPGGAPLNKKEIGSRGNGGGSGCFNCGEVGHMAKDCRNGGGNSYGSGGRGAGGEGCYNCGEVGHMAKDCRTVGGNSYGSGGRGAGGEGCYNCGGVGHFARECRQIFGGNVGGGGSCYSCGGFGHMARDCKSRRPAGACYECGGTGHLARDCDRRGSGGGGGGGGKCFNCGKEGHFARECSVGF